MPKLSLLFSLLTFTAVTFTPVISQAAELSPWMGGDGQAPFHLDPNTMVAVTFAADPLQTGSTTKRDCAPETCSLMPMPAKTLPSTP
jgi:hypothetical protein